MGVQPKISLCPRPRVSSSATRVGSSWKRRARNERRTAKRALAKLRPRTRTSTIRALLPEVRDASCFRVPAHPRRSPSTRHAAGARGAERVLRLLRGLITRRHLQGGGVYVA